MANYKNKKYNYNIGYKDDLNVEDKSRNVAGDKNNKRVENKSYEGDSLAEKSIESSLTSISENFRYFIEEVVNPKIVDVNKNSIPVTVKHENAEDIVDIQKLGYIRDKTTNKPIIPLITFKRRSIEKENYFPTLLRNIGENRIILTQKNDNKNKYLDYNNKPFYPTREYVSVGVPDFVRIPFDLNVWTGLSQELDYILERMYYYEGAYYGKSGGSPSKISITDSSINIMKDVDNQRLVRSNISFEVTGKLILGDLNESKNVTKEYSNRIVRINEKIE